MELWVRNTQNVIETPGGHDLPERNICKWHKQFKEGRESVEDEDF